MARAPIDDNHHKGLIAADSVTGAAKALTSTDVGGDPALNVNVVQSVGSGGGSSIYKKLIDETTTTSVTYIGEAALGTAESSAGWRIKKIDETSGVAITWSGTGFDVKWTERATVVTYS